MPDKPLKGVVVCDYGQHGAGSACGKVLADWGADVIKVEPLWGCPSRQAGGMVGLSTDPGENAHHEMINSGKRSIAVDLKTERGRDIMDKIIAKSHIFFSNYRLRSLKKYGLDYETLSQKYPKLIWGHLNGFGTEGPMCDEPGFDNVSYWAYGGLIMNAFDPDEEPRWSPFAGGDVMTGYVLASSMAACLYQQAVTGKGQSVYTSLYGVGCWQDACVIQAAADHEIKAVKKKDPIGTFRKCKDGTWFTMGIMDFAKNGPRIAGLIGREDLAGNFSTRSGMMENSEEYRTILDEFFIDYTWPEVDKMLTEIDMVHSKIQRPKDVAYDPQAIANGFVWDYSLRDGKMVKMISTPVKFGRQEPIGTTHAPLIGENSTDILKELGYSSETIEELFRESVIREEHYKEE